MKLLKIKKQWVLAAAMSVALAMPVSFVLAAPPAAAPIDTGLETTAGGAGLKTGTTAVTPQSAIGTVLGTILSFVGLLFLVLMVYGGILWMTAQGEPEKVKKAMAIIKSAIIGLVIVSAGYIITNFVITEVFKAAGIR